MRFNWKRALKIAAIIAVSAAIGGVAVYLLAPVVAGALGFSSIGPVAGSAAAAIQAGIGSTVAAGSMFAVAQSIGMGAAVPAVVPVVGGAVAAALGAFAIMVIDSKRPGPPAV